MNTDQSHDESPDQVRIPDFRKFDPDQLVRFFKENPGDYFPMMVRFRNQERVSPDELLDWKNRLTLQMDLPRQSILGRNVIADIVTQIDILLGIYNTTDDQPPYTSEFFSNIIDDRSKG